MSIDTSVTPRTRWYHLSLNDPCGHRPRLRRSVCAHRAQQGSLSAAVIASRTLGGGGGGGTQRRRRHDQRQRVMAFQPASSAWKVFCTPQTRKSIPISPRVRCRREARRYATG
eukprot:scaffold31252_cov63-Phaeocystis_antarctica.AAC.7